MSPSLIRSTTTLSRPFRILPSTLAATARPPHPHLHFSVTRPNHQFSHSALLSYPRKDSQDKDSINTEASEYSKSGTDDASAREADPAFNPEITDPQEQLGQAEKKSGESSNPLDVSPANPEVSKARGQTEGGAENSSQASDTTSDRQRSSGGSSPPKGGKVR